MIFLNYSPFANTKNKYFDGLNKTLRYEKARFEKAIFDEVHMIESADILCTADKKDWGYDTVFLWKGSGIEAGNIELKGLPINQILVKRRKKEDFTFEHIKTFDFDKDVDFYEFKDRFIESYEDYVYGIQPMGGSLENPILGETTIGEVETEFDSVWIVGKNTQYKLMYNLEVGDYETVIPNTVIETLGSQFPIVSVSGNIKYRRGNLRYMLISDETMKMHGGINPKEEKKIRRAIMSFLTDKKPKYFKDGNGDTMLISILGAPTLTPRNELGRLLYDMNVEFVEVGNTSIQDLVNVNLLEGVD